MIYGVVCARVIVRPERLALGLASDASDGTSQRVTGPTLQNDVLRSDVNGQPDSASGLGLVTFKNVIEESDVVRECFNVSCYYHLLDKFSDLPFESR